MNVPKLYYLTMPEYTSIPTETSECPKCFGDLFSPHKAKVYGGHPLRLHKQQDEKTERLRVCAREPELEDILLKTFRGHPTGPCRVR